jgi:hypothetical protein
MKTKTLLMAVMSLLSIHSYAATKCDIKVETKQVKSVEVFSSTDRNFNLSGSSCNEKLLENTLIAECINKLGTEAECLVVSKESNTIINPITHVPVLGRFWKAEVGGKCTMTVHGKTYLKKNSEFIKREKCDKIDQCIENSTIDGNDDELNTMLNLKRNLSCN